MAIISTQMFPIFNNNNNNTNHFFIILLRLQESTTSIVNNSLSISNGGYGNNYSKNLSRSYNKYSNAQVSQLLYMLPPQTESSSTATIASGASVSVKREDDTNNGSNAPLAMKINM